MEIYLELIGKIKKKIVKEEEENIEITESE